jgi:hypothetical protein
MSIFQHALNFILSLLPGRRPAAAWAAQKDVWAQAVVAEDGDALILLGKE